MNSFREALRTPKKPRLDRIDPDETLGLGREEGEALLARNKEALGHLGYHLYAEGKRSLLVVLQAMDAAGKDGVVRHVMTGLNPQGVRVSSFKTPTDRELRHDFLWRIHPAVPGHGEIGVFNRSHYEDVLIVRVKKLAPKRIWKARFAQIRHFEELLAANGTAIVKLFLHIDKDEQRKRLQARIDNPEKNWKFTTADIRERALWEDYQVAYQEAIARCDRDQAPWYIVPANRKWFRNAAVSQLLVETLTDMNLKLPKPVEDLRGITVE